MGDRCIAVLREQTGGFRRECFPRATARFTEGAVCCSICVSMVRRLAQSSRLRIFAPELTDHGLLMDNASLDVRWLMSDGEGKRMGPALR
jgi:hypothetical protein